MKRPVISMRSFFLHRRQDSLGVVEVMVSILDTRIWVFVSLSCRPRPSLDLHASNSAQRETLHITKLRRRLMDQKDHFLWGLLSATGLVIASVLQPIVSFLHPDYSADPLSILSPSLSKIIFARNDVNVETLQSLVIDELPDSRAHVVLSAMKRSGVLVQKIFISRIAQRLSALESKPEQLEKGFEKSFEELRGEGSLAAVLGSREAAWDLFMDAATDALHSRWMSAFADGRELPEPKGRKALQGEFSSALIFTHGSPMLQSEKVQSIAMRLAAAGADYPVLRESIWPMYFTAEAWAEGRRFPPETYAPLPTPAEQAMARKVLHFMTDRRLSELICWDHGVYAWREVLRRVESADRIGRAVMAEQYMPAMFSSNEHQCRGNAQPKQMEILVDLMDLFLSIPRLAHSMRLNVQPNCRKIEQVLEAASTDPHSDALRLCRLLVPLSEWIGNSSEYNERKLRFATRWVERIIEKPLLRYLSRREHSEAYRQTIRKMVDFVNLEIDYIVGARNVPHSLTDALWQTEVGWKLDMDVVATLPKTTRLTNMLRRR